MKIAAALPTIRRFLAVLAALTLSACAIQLLADYNQKIDDGITDLQSGAIGVSVQILTSCASR